MGVDDMLDIEELYGLLNLGGKRPLRKEILMTNSVFNKLKRNRAICLICGDVIESKFVHDFATCSCGNLSVDGGLEYAGRTFLSSKWRDMCEYESVLGVMTK